MIDRDYLESQPHWQATFRRTRAGARERLIA